MITKYAFGKSFNTEAVVDFPENAVVVENPASLPFGKISFPSENVNKPKAFGLEIKLSDIDKIFGLGETLGGINKRGKTYKSWCTDDPNHVEDKEALYGAHNFLIHYSPETKKIYGLFIDFPGLIKYDIGFTKINLMTIFIEQADFDLYLIETDADTKNPFDSIVTQFRRMIGKSYVPPFWAMGFMQSRWGYASEADLNRIYDNYRKNDIPLDAIFLDIDYMEDFKDFTINKNNFSDFADAVRKLKDKNVHVVPIIDAGIKADETFEIDKEGVEKNYFCRKNDGKLLACGVWPGLSHFTDFLNPEARAWFGSKYKILTDMGIDGFWNDMNEPAFFYSEDGLKSAFSKIRNMINDENPNVYKTWDIKNEILNVQNKDDDYRSFYHKVPEKLAGNLGEKAENGFSKVNHWKVHNLYGYNMTRAASEYFKKAEPDKNILLISRASYIGMHRMSGIWTGDNIAWWSHLLLCIKQLPSLNMCGFLYSGCDLGGFSGNTSRELLLRFLSLGVFTPLMRNHSALGTREQECYQFEKTEDFKGIIQFRYRILPYLWETFNDCAENGKMFFKPLAFEFSDDEIASQTEDQLLLGDDLMICPVYQQNATGRTVYLPEEMTKVTCKKGAGLDTGKPALEKLPMGLHYIEVPANQIVFFIRNGKEIFVTEPASTTAELDLNRTEIWK